MTSRTLFPPSRPFVRRMDRRVLPLIVGLLFLSLGCGGDDDPTGPLSQACNPASAIVTFPDDRPPIVVPPTVLVQPSPEAWGEGRRVSGVSGRPDRAGSLPEPGAGSPESYEDGWCCTRAATVR